MGEGGTSRCGVAELLAFGGIWNWEKYKNMQRFDWCLCILQSLQSIKEIAVSLDHAA